MIHKPILNAFAITMCYFWRTRTAIITLQLNNLD